MQTSIKIQAAKLFAKNPAYKELYAFADGNIFSNENFAKSHQLHCKMQYQVLRRSDVATTSQDPKKEVKKEAKASKTKEPQTPKGQVSEGDVKKLEHQLVEMDLTKPDGKLYATYKAIGDGLNVKRENNKLETIIASLVEAQKKLTNKSQE